MDNDLLLYYGHDPMCSFCWAYRPVWIKVREQLVAHHPEIRIASLMGGLAPDSDQPMPLQLQNKIKNTWRYIEQQIPGTRFNFDFWEKQQPRRSTYPACRAVIAAQILDPQLEDGMILAIQEAYYLNARNPSDEDTLTACAESIGLGRTQFVKILRSPECEKRFAQQREQSRQLGINGFPSLVLTRGSSRFHIPVDYRDGANQLESIIETSRLL